MVPFRFGAKAKALALVHSNITSGDQRKFSRVLHVCGLQEFLHGLTCIIRSLVLATMSDKLITNNDDEKSTLNFIHEYLESRVVLLKSIKVSIFYYLQRC